MGKTARQFQSKYIEFTKKFKKPFKQIALIVPNDFTDDLFVEIFTTHYKYLYEEIEIEFKYWFEKNKEIINYEKKSRFNFPSPKNFILFNSLHIRKKRRLTKSELTEKQISEIVNMLIDNNSTKLKKKHDKQKERLELIQEIFPNHISKYIDEYFKISVNSQNDLDKKFYLIREVAKYKNQESISFLQKVNAKEQNFDLKNEACKFLQQFNEKVILRKKKKGVKKFKVEGKQKIVDNPDTLINQIYNEQLEDINEIDIFLSHSSLDRDKLVIFFKLLNQNGFYTYLDWVNDRHYLKRELLNINTVNVLLKRLQKSKILIYYHTEASNNSPWTPWEIGYFSGLHKKVFIYNPSQINKSFFLNIYPEITIENNQIFISEQNKKILLDKKSINGLR
jgi:hypothetical protein